MFRLTIHVPTGNSAWLIVMVQVAPVKLRDGTAPIGTMIVEPDGGGSI